MVDEYDGYAVGADVASHGRVEKSAGIDLCVDYYDWDLARVDVSRASAADLVVHIFEHTDIPLTASNELLVCDCGRHGGHVAVRALTRARVLWDGHEQAGHDAAVLSGVVGIFECGISQGEVRDGDFVVVVVVGARDINSVCCAK